MTKPKNYLAMLDSFGLSFPEWRILSEIGYGPRPPASLRNFQLEGYEWRAISADEIEQALSSCIAKRWLRIMDLKAKHEVRKFLEDRKITSPLYGLPAVGDVDFTVKGASLYSATCRRLFGPLHVSSGYVKQKWQRGTIARYEYFYRYKKTATEALANFRAHKNVVAVSDLGLIGPWCVFWWHPFSRGYRIRVTIAGR